MIRNPHKTLEKALAVFTKAQVEVEKAIDGARIAVSQKKKELADAKDVYESMKSELEEERAGLEYTRDRAIAISKNIRKITGEVA